MAENQYTHFTFVTVHKQKYKKKAGRKRNEGAHTHTHTHKGGQEAPWGRGWLSGWVDCSKKLKLWESVWLLTAGAIFGDQRRRRDKKRDQNFLPS